MLYLFIFFTSLIVTIFSTPFLIQVLVRNNVVDIPGGRRINTSAIPRMGGILIYGIILSAVLIFNEDSNLTAPLLFSSGIAALCGVLDDTRGMKWYYKFLMQSFSSAFILSYIYPMLRRIELFGTVIPFPFDIILLFIFLTGLVNALNMLDGMDGLVSGFSLLQFMLIFFLSFNIGNTFLLVLSLAAVGSLIGFLKFNASPAKIFLGDTGSLVLGFFLGVSVILLMNAYSPASLDLGFPIIVLGVPFIDILRVMITRLWNGKSIFYPDNNHIHHLISGNNIRHKTTVFLIQAFTLFFILLSLVYLFYDKFTAYVLFCISGIILSLINPLLHRFKSFKLLNTFIARIFPAGLVTVDLYKKILLPVSAVIVLLLIFFLFPVNTNLSVDIILLMMVILGLLFIASFISSKRNHTYNDLYVLLNLLLFFSISSVSEPVIRFERVLWDALSYIPVLLILMFFIVLLLSRNRKTTLFTGVDLIMMVFLISIIIIEHFLDIDELHVYEGNSVAAFIVYIWYKMIKVLMPKLNRPLFYLTFILLFTSLIVISF